MPAEELVELGARLAFQAVVNTVPELIFNRHVARYFHGVGRRAIAVLSLGTIRIESSLRIIPIGEEAKPKGADWAALILGVLIFGTSGAGAVAALLFL